MGGFAMAMLNNQMVPTFSSLLQMGGFPENEASQNGWFIR
jgi:hypothetical protein